MDWEFPKRLPRGFRSSWIRAGADDTWLEVKAKHGWVGIGPLTITFAVNWEEDWLPRPYRSAARRYNEWLDWCRTIHVDENPEQHESRARMLSR